LRSCAPTFSLIDTVRNRSDGCTSLSLAGPLSGALGIPGVRDRVVQQATKLVIEPIFEADFRDCSYGFRPRRSAHQALEKVRTVANQGMRWVVDADIKSFFDEIDFDVVLKLIGRRVSDRGVHKLIKSWLHAGVMEEGTVRTTTAGTPQGGVSTPPAMLQNG
jgi:RNA-directed DNA polymerase